MIKYIRSNYQDAKQPLQKLWSIDNQGFHFSLFPDKKPKSQLEKSFQQFWTFFQLLHSDGFDVKFSIFYKYPKKV